MDMRPPVTIARDEGESPMTKVTPFLMFNDQLQGNRAIRSGI
jgi:hypothetical protein